MGIRAVVSYRARRSIAILAMALPLFLGLVSGAARAASVFEIDPAHSSIGFSIRHLFTMVPGRFDRFSANIAYDEGAPEKSRTEFTIDAASVSTDNAKRDGHLRSPDFFNAEKFPTLTFQSTKVEKTDQKNVFKVTGDFTMLGVTKPVTVQVEVVGIGPDGFGNTKGGFQVTGALNRKDFGMVWNKALDTGSTLLGDEVKFQVSIEAVKKVS
jgi:polyisoprenoid-binding protein YceI